MLEQSDIIDYNGHCSVRLDDNRVLINIGSCQRSRLTVEDICTIDLEATRSKARAMRRSSGTCIAGSTACGPTSRPSCTRHPKWSTFLTMVGESYKPVYAQGSLVHPVAAARFAQLDQQPGDGGPAGGDRSATGPLRS